MGYDRLALKRPVNLSLNQDLVREARELTPNLSETVESLLAEFVAVQRHKREQARQQIDALVAASNGFIAAHGAFGDEFSTL